MTLSPEWIAAAVPLDFDGSHEPVAGWRYGHLFLDFRPLRNAPNDGGTPFCWMVCHTVTGLAVVGLRTDLTKAQRMVELLHDRLPWATIAAVKDQAAPQEVQDWVDCLPFGWCMAIDTIPPTVEVFHRRGETVQ